MGVEDSKVTEQHSSRGGFVFGMVALNLTWSVMNRCERGPSLQNLNYIFNMYWFRVFSSVVRQPCTLHNVLDISSAPTGTVHGYHSIIDYTSCAVLTALWLFCNYQPVLLSTSTPLTQCPNPPSPPATTSSLFVSMRVLYFCSFVLFFRFHI